ncbi:StAR-related lipid transfer protein 7, mitochondrial [Morella rubra]|uniref:StAR-related lipid transfer protein 7, mitochondrial n=1 Tax=Morella rubra TaxID=262757 RepID=A0A6A1V787_9ROSI|nr:StAR-related lipid transfer protein 7, mitochondrial [Morella rubra]
MVDVLSELMIFIVPLWLACIVGVLVGWAWRPKWAQNLGNYSASKDASPVSPTKALSTCFTSILSLSPLKFQLPSCVSWIAEDREDLALAPVAAKSDFSSSQHEAEKSALVTGQDLEHLCRIVEEKDGGPAWIQMMDRSTPTMSYQAWRRDPETGPPQYRSRTLYEDASPELVRDFFWDDEFRLKWDDMLINAATLKDCPTTGTMVVQWVRKFPFFCSDREYIIGRRIWESGRSYYCVTKGIPCSSVPRRNKPRRVDLFYSSWCIRAAESKKGDGQLTACEVLLFHHEDMGIPWEIAKLGVRQGMWGAVKKIDPALRTYQKLRASGAPLSHCAVMAQINTKVNPDYLRSLENNSNNISEVENLDSSENPKGRNIPKLLVVGGAILLACSLDRGLLTKAVIFGVARRFGRIGRKL